MHALLPIVTKVSKIVLYNEPSNVVDKPLNAEN